MTNFFSLQIFAFLLFLGVYQCQAIARYKFVVQEAPYTRLCSTKNILTVNGQFPGPTLHVHKGETIIVDVYNKGHENITIHWHGVEQPRNPWSDGPEFVTQCPIKPGGNFSQKVIFSVEEGTLWWHAHNDWSRATVHGAIIVKPKPGTTYPFPKPYAEQILILGTFKLNVDQGKTYLLRLINAAMQDIFFFSIANHNFTVVGSDASYLKPFTSDLMAISPGQTMDILLTANQKPDHYYMGAKVYAGSFGADTNNSTTTAILQYNGNYTASSPPLLPKLPTIINDTDAAFNFVSKFRSLADKDHPIHVPLKIKEHFYYTLSINVVPCEANQTCFGPRGQKLAASMNNISYQSPKMDILEAYYFQTNGVFGTNFPSNPPFFFNFTAANISRALQLPRQATEVKVLDYNTTVEIVFQATNLVRGTDHPMHLHGFSFYVVGSGRGNFDKDKDPLNYNLVDPPLQNTIAVPINGWTAIRFEAHNPGVWFMHCHFERHAIWGMDTVFIVKNGKKKEERMLPRPSDMPPCN
ncbi:Multicopper oxidase, type 1 [Corchorus olitorius]|uniref:laccase n=1 Tax=Corchorus olitorius TaxID=93759 RepID=A0A1R3GL44_9ROSI|nr:Multicopper oxidase, type 1 [Corchorus olitorius]